MSRPRRNHARSGALSLDDRLANRDRHLTLSPDGNGRTRQSGVLDTVSAATVTAARPR